MIKRFLRFLRSDVVYWCAVFLFIGALLFMVVVEGR